MQPKSKEIKIFRPSAYLKGPGGYPTPRGGGISAGPTPPNPHPHPTGGGGIVSGSDQALFHNSAFITSRIITIITTHPHNNGNGKHQPSVT